MKKILILLFISITLLNCTSDKFSVDVYESESLRIHKVSENVYVHISYLNTNDFGKVDCNGMIYINNNEAAIFDTPIDISASEELTNWIVNDQKVNIKAVIATHFHSDCLGGLKHFHNNGIESYASNNTIKLAIENDISDLPIHGFDYQLSINVGNKRVLAKYFGEGHTKDNIVGYVPNENILFGGCLIKSLKAGRGFLGDANIEEWSNSVRNLKKQLPELNIVIPGHGKYGGDELLDYTIKLFD